MGRVTLRIIRRKKRARRKSTPRRYRDLRSDGRVGKALRTIATTLGLPAEAILILLPGGRKARTDKTIASLRRDWNEAS